MRSTRYNIPTITNTNATHPKNPTKSPCVHFANSQFVPGNSFLWSHRDGSANYVPIFA
jgi:hypothetical protein